jgi:hypothetical protein
MHDMPMSACSLSLVSEAPRADYTPSDGFMGLGLRCG